MVTPLIVDSSASLPSSSLFQIERSGSGLTIEADPVRGRNDNAGDAARHS